MFKWYLSEVIIDIITKNDKICAALMQHFMSTF